MRHLLVAVSALAVWACDSAPSEESPVAPPVVCESPAVDGTCPDYDPVVSPEDLRDGQVES